MPGPSHRRRCLLLAVVLITGCTGLQIPGGAPIPSTGSAAATTSPPSRSPTPTVRTPTPTPLPTPSPTATPDPHLIELAVTSCNGGVVLDWSASRHPDFDHYTALRSPDETIEPDWPPIAPAVDWGDTYATDAFVTSAADASIVPSERVWHYRVMAYDADDEVVGASPVRSARLHPLASLGRLTVTATDGGTRIGWEPYDGFSGCFSSYQVLAGIGVGPPSTLGVVSDQSASSLVTDALHAGTTYQLRVRAVRTTTLGTFVVAQTTAASYSVP